MQLSNFFNDATGATSNMDEKTYADVLDMEQFYQDLERSPVSQ